SCHRPGMPYESEWCERAFQFSCKLFDFCDEVAVRPGPSRRLANQLFDAGSSIGANLEEAKAASSRRDKRARTSISLRECRESKYWLRIAIAKNLGERSRRDWLFREADAFVAMLTVAVRKLNDRTE